MGSMPIWLIVSTSLQFAFTHAQHLHSQNFRGSSRRYQVALIVSSFLGFIALTAAIVYYFFQVSWYWPIILFFLSGAIGTLFLTALRSFLDEFIVSMLAFIGWPVCTAWAIYIVHGLAP